MAIARALTTRRKEDQPAATPTPYIGRAASQRAPNAKPIVRSDISLPVALISTTNMLSYEAPDIIDAPHVRNMGGRYFSSGSSSVSSGQSDVDSDRSGSTGSVHSHETDATSVDISSPDMSDNHLSEFFKSGGTQRSTRSTISSNASRSNTHSLSNPSAESPQLPSRAVSHSKTAHVLSHKRSVQRMATIPSETRTRDTMDMFNLGAVTAPSPAPPSNPFGKELEQLTEAAEEFGHAIRDAEADADSSVMRSKGLVRFCANDYMRDISVFYASAFEEDKAVFQPMVWI